MTDLQFKAYLRQIRNLLNDVINADDEEKQKKLKNLRDMITTDIES
ncbi:MAG: hypothetical protein LBM87_06600 [Ruminococcus sp.]|nr:hypothetical protein [Ruminococcus sp.]